MPNKGIAPPQMDTLVGQTRGLIGDVTYKALVPSEVGFGDYAYFSDLEIEAFLAIGGDSPLRATGYAFRQLAASFTVEQVEIATDDLRINTTKRGATLLEIAQSYFDEADAADAKTASYFEIVQPRRPSRDRCPW